MTLRSVLLAATLLTGCSQLPKQVSPQYKLSAESAMLSVRADPISDSRDGIYSRKITDTEFLHAHSHQLSYSAHGDTTVVSIDKNLDSVTDAALVIPAFLQPAEAVVVANDMLKDPKITSSSVQRIIPEGYSVLLIENLDGCAVSSPVTPEERRCNDTERSILKTVSGAINEYFSSLAYSSSAPE